MSAPHVKYLLLGGGVAASAAAVAIRGRDADGAIMLVGQEVNRPYRRTVLRRGFLTRAVSHQELFTLPEEWFARHKVELHTGRRGVHIDAHRGWVALDDGTDVAFDKLLIATGAGPRPLSVKGAELPGVMALHSIEDAELLRNTIEKAKHEGTKHAGGRGRAVIVGAGARGVELADTLTTMGLACDLVMEAAWPVSRYLGQAAGQYLARAMEARGVVLHAEGGPDRIEGDGRVQRVVLRDGRVLPADFVVGVVAGAEVHKSILRGTPIAAEKAILVDEGCATNVANIWAAGDCAAVRDPATGKYRLPGPWDSAELTGRIAGANMAGASERLDAPARVDIAAFDVTITGYGEARAVDRRLVRGNVSQGRFTEIGVAPDGHIAQIVSVGPEDPGAEPLVRNRTSVLGREEDIKNGASWT